MAFTPEENQILSDLERELDPMGWPPASPLAFVTHLAPATKGKLGREIVRRVAKGLGVSCNRSGSNLYTYNLNIAGATIRAQIKFSTDEQPRFQQVRDPRTAAGRPKYDALLCISARPFDLVYWIMDTNGLTNLIDAGHIPIQHQDSSSRWIEPSRATGDAFAFARTDFAGLVQWLTTGVYP